ncbi:DNA-binding MarR family transcriptional regulator [Thermocatellispora tengchongensis]|uniref:DNA-binding MarR family transcriptional regulator n=1 Tax=Thermocatellispora tengchongensis TaxID=1073253 RepID=A0A840PM40_9ACTN|nr:MarR family transcriptional regulator [Thermocatellispora tengchongensis]MBB5140142.1 DNA-binding MarR family transcriptional regulator [Thermocatellispora tengchongensis]
MRFDPKVYYGDEGPIEEWPIPRLFGLAVRMATLTVAGRTEETGMSTAAFMLLSVLEQRDGAKVSEVAESLMVTAATATSVADTLERAGLVERRRDDRDRRVVRLHLTGAGRDRLAETKLARRDRWRALFGEVPPEDEPAVRRFLLGAIHKLKEAAE